MKCALLEKKSTAENWENIGEALRLRPNKLERIRQDSTNKVDCLCGVLNEWLEGEYNTQRFGSPSWKQLVKAVAHEHGGNDCYLAEWIDNKYNGNLHLQVLI